MEEQLSPLAATQLLQHTLRSFCIQENSLWLYAVFWRILPRNYPPPKWDGQGRGYDKTRGNRRNWYGLGFMGQAINCDSSQGLYSYLSRILAWEDGFCNFAASVQGLQPELFFKMSHEIYNYGEGSIGKVAADQGHKWVYPEHSEQEPTLLSAWHPSVDSHPRTWEAQFQSGIQTIALIAVREGVVQLGSLQKIIEDPNYVFQVRKRFGYIGSIPGVFLPHPSALSSPPPPPPMLAGYTADLEGGGIATSQYVQGGPPPTNQWSYDCFHQQPLAIAPSMSSLEALLSKLPSVVPDSSSSLPPPQPPTHQLPCDPQGYPTENEMDAVESSSSMPYFFQLRPSQYGDVDGGGDDRNVDAGGPDGGY